MFPMLILMLYFFFKVVDIKLIVSLIFNLPISGARSDRQQQEAPVEVELGPARVSLNLFCFYFYKCLKRNFAWSKSQFLCRKFIFFCAVSAFT